MDFRAPIARRRVAVVSSSPPIALDKFSMLRHGNFSPDNILIRRSLRILSSPAERLVSRKCLKAMEPSVPTKPIVPPMHAPIIAANPLSTGRSYCDALSIKSSCDQSRSVTQPHRCAAVVVRDLLSVIEWFQAMCLTGNVHMYIVQVVWLDM